MYRIWKDFRHW